LEGNTGHLTKVLSRQVPGDTDKTEAQRQLQKRPPPEDNLPGEVVYCNKTKWHEVPEQSVIQTRHAAVHNDSKMGGACGTSGKKRGAYRVMVWKLDGRRPIGRPRRRWEDNIKSDLKGKSVERASTGFIWLRIGTSGGLL
jgi:hypothetical protein